LPTIGPMSDRNEDTRAGVRRCLGPYVKALRDSADEACAEWGVDDPLHPYGEQAFRDWLDFVDRVARPLVEADGDHDAEQAAMKLYRQASPYYICTALVLAVSPQMRTERDRLRAVVDAVRAMWDNVTLDHEDVMSFPIADYDAIEDALDAANRTER
jgi:hypothetical protein